MTLQWKLAFGALCLFAYYGWLYYLLTKDAMTESQAKNVQMLVIIRDLENKLAVAQALGQFLRDMLIGMGRKDV